jgi:hypothetical protein
MISYGTFVRINLLNNKVKTMFSLILIALLCFATPMNAMKTKWHEVIDLSSTDEDFEWTPQNTKRVRREEKKIRKQPEKTNMAAPQRVTREERAMHKLTTSVETYSIPIPPANQMDADGTSVVMLSSYTETNDGHAFDKETAKLYIFNRETKKSIARTTNNNIPFGRRGLCIGNTNIYAGMADNTVAIFDQYTGQEKAIMLGHRDLMRFSGITTLEENSVNPSQLLSGDANGNLLLSDIDAGHWIVSTSIGSRVGSMSCAPDGSHIAIQNGNNEIVCVDPRIGEMVARWDESLCGEKDFLHPDHVAHGLDSKITVSNRYTKKGDGDYITVHDLRHNNWTSGGQRGGVHKPALLKNSQYFTAANYTKGTVELHKIDIPGVISMEPVATSKSYAPLKIKNRPFLSSRTQELIYHLPKRPTSLGIVSLNKACEALED